VASCILAANAAGRSFSKFASLLLCVHAVNLGTRHWWFHIIVVVDFVTFAGLFKNIAVCFWGTSTNLSDKPAFKSSHSHQLASAKPTRADGPAWGD
jgi:hypothetical protein